MRLTKEQLQEIHDQIDSARDDLMAFTNSQVNGNTFGRTIAMAELMRLTGESLISEMKETMNPEAVALIQKIVRDCYESKISHEHQNKKDRGSEE
jgi:hypothetical protein